MSDAPFVLVDRVRAEQLMLLGRTRRLFHRCDIHSDRDGIVWAMKRLGNHAFACTWLGPGWVFDPFASRIWAAKRVERLLSMQQAAGEIHHQQLGLVLRQLRLGAHSERLLWFIHQQVMQTLCSVIQPADLALATAVWGRERRSWPRHWRQELTTTLLGLAWLHVAEWPISGLPSLGMHSALLTHVADLRGHEEDQ
jgi:hypothetical protein